MSGGGGGDRGRHCGGRRADGEDGDIVGGDHGGDHGGRGDITARIMTEKEEIAVKIVTEEESVTKKSRWIVIPSSEECGSI